MEFNIYFLAVILEVIIFSSSINACDEINCLAMNGAVCNEHGDCDCGVCKCSGYFSGPTCEECPTCPSPCDIFKGCVGCKIFGTGELSIMDCILKCDDIANYIPVDKSEFDVTSDNETICQTLNKKYCMESFRVGGMNYGYRDLYVRTEEDCAAKYLPTNPPVIEVTLDVKEEKKTTTSSSKEDMNDEHMEDNKRPINVAAVAGSSKGNTYDGNSADIVKFSNYGVLIIALSFILS